MHVFRQSHGWIIHMLCSLKRDRSDQQNENVSDKLRFLFSWFYHSSSAVSVYVHCLIYSGCNNAPLLRDSSSRLREGEASG